MSHIITVIDKATGLAIDPQVAPVEGDWIQSVGHDDTTYYEFHEPVVLEYDPIRLISVRAFMQRLAQTERTDMRNSTDDIIVDMMDDLRMSTYVDLDGASLLPGLGYANSLGLIAAHQLVDMVIDGTEAESYNGVL